MRVIGIDLSGPKNHKDTVLTILKQEENHQHVKKGYLVNYIETNGSEGKLYLEKTSPQKSGYNFHALAERYNVESLEIIYE